MTLAGLKSTADLDVRGKRVLVRADLNESAAGKVRVKKPPSRLPAVVRTP